MTTISFSPGLPETNDEEGYKALTFTGIGSTELPPATIEYEPLLNIEVKQKGKIEAVCLPYISMASAEALLNMMHDIAVERGDYDPTN